MSTYVDGMPQIGARRYRAITRLALWSICGIIVTGAAVRLTGSGLGCSDWPTCEDNRLVAPFEFHAQVEFINRLITGLVSLSVIAALAASFLRVPRRRDLTRWSSGLIVGVAAQVVIGGMVTLSDLKYSVVAIHFLVSMVLVWAAVVLVDHAADEKADRPGAPPPRCRWSPDARIIVGLVALVLCTGPLVTSAGPHAGDQDVARLSLDLSSVARVHAVSVWLLCAAVAVIAFRRRHGAVNLLAAIVVQGIIGYTQYFSDVPALLVGIHVAGSVVVWVMAIRYALDTRIDDEVPEPSMVAA